MLHRETAEKGMRVKSHELTDHPIRVCSNPDGNGKVMAELRNELPGSPGNDDRHD